MRSLYTIALATILAGVVQPIYAADMPTKGPVAPLAPAVAPYNWTGFYLGGHFGYGWGTLDVTNVNGSVNFPAGLERSKDINGWLGGFQGGYNWQFAPNWLIGIEGEYSFTDIDGDEDFVSPVNSDRISHSHDRVKWTATATGRLGYAMQNWLFYAKGGAAWAHTEVTSHTTNAVGTLVFNQTNGSDTRTGWTVGGGVEWGFWGNWSAKLEYDYMNFGTKTESRNNINFIGTSPNPLLRDVDFKLNVVKLGINYRFN
jgi:outer membrane immunogenic protein